MFVKRNRPFYVADGVPGGQPPANPQPQAGDPPANPSGTGEPDLTPAEYKRMIAELRKENAGHRTKLSAFEKAQAEADAAKLSDQQKLEKRATEAEAKATAQEKALQEMRVALAIERNAARLNIVDPEAAVKLIDLSAIDPDNPKTITDALEALVKAKPYLVAQQTPKPVSSGGASNPPRANSGAGGLTRQIIESMSPSEYRARRPEIMKWLAENKQ